MVVFVIVVYKIKPSECIALSSLISSLCVNGVKSFKILILDNSPGSDSIYKIESKFDYFAFGSNVGLAHAYNYALNYCKRIGAEFIVTLDQDSTVTLDYIDEIFKCVKIYAGKEVVLCPTIMCGNRQVSPFSYSPIGVPRYKISGELHAINSFSVYSVNTLISLKIIDEFYWLDALDFSIFENLHRNKIPVIPMHVQVQHDLSLLHEEIGRERLVNIALYEAAFLFEYCGPVRLLSGLLRLLFRVVRRVNYRNKIEDLCVVLQAIMIGSFRGLIRRLWRHSKRKNQK